MKIILLLISTMLSAIVTATPWHWTTALNISERHEFYQNNELISKPQGTWQTLFAVEFPGADLTVLKDCLFYKVPGEGKGDGELKVTRIPSSDLCEAHIERKGDSEWKTIKALQFSIDKNKISIHITHPDYRVEQWNIPIINKLEKQKAGNLVSSAAFKSTGFLFVSLEQAEGGKASNLPDNSVCHKINDDCIEESTSRCSECSNGWYEIPNGCRQGPKYCGTIECGRKNRPACRRGYKWQRVRKKYNCRSDNSFAYCAEGLTIVCEGSLAFCR